MKSDQNYQEELVLLGNRIRSLREVRGFSQETLGFKAGLHRNFISKLELAQKNPTFTTLIKLASALDVDIVELITFYDNKST